MTEVTPPAEVVDTVVPFVEDALSELDVMRQNHLEEVASLRTQLEAATRVPQVSQDEANLALLAAKDEEIASLRAQLAVQSQPEPEAPPAQP